MSPAANPFLILLAEDEPADAHLVRTALVANNIQAELRHVLDGREVLEYLHGQHTGFAQALRPDLILLDLNMPRMDGHECLRAIKQDQTLRAIPTVILTTSEADRDIQASYQLGAAGYVTKPVDMEQFIEAIGILCSYWMALVRRPAYPSQRRDGRSVEISQ